MNFHFEIKHFFIESHADLGNVTKWSDGCLLTTVHLLLHLLQDIFVKYLFQIKIFFLDVKFVFSIWEFSGRLWTKQNSFPFSTVQIHSRNIHWTGKLWATLQHVNEVFVSLQCLQLVTSSLNYNGTKGAKLKTGSWYCLSECSYRPGLHNPIIIWNNVCYLADLYYGWLISRNWQYVMNISYKVHVKTWSNCSIFDCVYITVKPHCIQPPHN